MPLAVGLTLGEVAAHTVDEAGREAFVTEHVLSLMRKVRTGYRGAWCGGHWVS